MTTTAPATLALLAEDAVVRRPLAGTMWLGVGRRRGSTVDRLPGGGWRRAEQGSAGPLVLEVRTANDRLVLQVWGPAATRAEESARAMVATRAWAGLEDDPTGFDELVGPHPLLRRALRHLGTPIIGRLPRAAESFGRAVLGQLVQGLEAARSTAEMVRMLGTPTPHGIVAYPTRHALGSTAAHQLRRCGIATRPAGALHRFAVDEPIFESLHARRDHAAMDARVRRIPGAGVWTSAETRLYLGDADAVSYGDYHIPTLVGWAIGERTETDQAMAELLSPYAPQRGRVIRLIERAARHGLVPSKPRRGPRAPASAHRYW